MQILRPLQSVKVSRLPFNYFLLSATYNKAQLALPFIDVLSLSNVHAYAQAVEAIPEGSIIISLLAI